MNKNDKILVAGSAGMVGSAILRCLIRNGFTNLVGTYHRNVPEKHEPVRYRRIDLLDPNACTCLFAEEEPDIVFYAAAKVGGIVANNTYRAQFLYENLQIQNNVIHTAYLTQVKKLMYLGSSCIYPKNAPQPIREEYLLTGALEFTNEPYAIAKIAGMKMCENYNLQYGTKYLSAMPTNLYGPNDNYDLQNSHVLPALIRKFHEAKITHATHVDIWGSGEPLREFLHVDDLAEAVVFLMENYSGNQFFNVGWGKDISIRDLATLIQEITGFEGKLAFDRSKPDGTPRKLLDVSRLTALGFTPRIHLREGIQSTYQDFLRKFSLEYSGKIL
ncbi:MAG TPA: GDP-L-fucose synthase [Bacteroidales bacterium]|nr:GDP-L-fucose synthase [Bacteroidales bacterium]HPS51694.1 GDP-L-fucose synthase [Bacteroidales bacterium]